MRMPAGAPEQRGQICSQLSREAGEPLYGSVSQTQAWFLLEYPHPMGAKAFAESTLLAPFKTAFSSYVDAIPGSRLLLIKQSNLVREEDVTLFVCLSRESDPALYEIRAGSYEELLALNFPALLAQDPAYDELRRSEPLFLVCTNGKRDPCCARWGLPLFTALSAAAPGQVWQSSHVGGHRFAPNLLCFPHGLYYGRVSPEGAPALLEAYRQGRLDPTYYRGRAAYPAPAQAGEYFLRRQTGELGLEAYRLLGVEPSGEQAWELRFAEAGGSWEHRLRVASRPAGVSAPESCSKEPRALQFYHLELYEKQEAGQSVPG